jgi:putative ABC transport system permease protein
MSEKRHGKQDILVFVGELRDSFFMAMDAIRSHKLRSALTLLGILVGVFSIIVVMTAMRAMQKQITNELDVLGGQTFVIEKWPAVMMGGPEAAEKYRRRNYITLQQGLALQEKATLARNVSIRRGLWVDEIKSRFAKGPPSVGLSGETAGSFPVQNWVVGQGRSITDADVDGYRDVCVLGNSLAKVLFPGESALNERVKINGINYSVIGVLEPKGSMAGGNQDNFVVIPITTALNRYGAWHWGVSILVQARDASSLGDAMDQVRGIMRALRKVPPGAEDDFEMYTNDSVLDQINSITFAVRIGVTIISSIALIAAGIGIMNIMLVSVTERTREIGIRRAIGAKKRNIMTQFIMEAIVLCEVGGSLGVILGILGGNLAGHLLHLPMVIPIDAVIVGLGICSLVGLIFGTYPAYKAANLDPIDSLRYE